MIDRSITETFPPHWVAASDDSALWWACPFTDPGGVYAVARFVAEKPDGSGYDDLGEVRRQPSLQGSFVHVDDTGVTLHLTRGDKALLIGRKTLFAVAVEAADLSDEVGGQLIVSDWAAVPHGGQA
jgi:hypothetical protein